MPQCDLDTAEDDRYEGQAATYKVFGFQVFGRHRRISGFNVTVLDDDEEVLSADENAGRLMSHFLVECMPKEGLSETIESLRELLMFYGSSMPRIEKANELRSVRATLTDSYIAPVLPPPEE